MKQSSKSLSLRRLWTSFKKVFSTKREESVASSSMSSHMDSQHPQITVSIEMIKSIIEKLEQYISIMLTSMENESPTITDSNKGETLVSKTLGAKAEQQFQASNSSENEETTDDTLSLTTGSPNLVQIYDRDGHMAVDLMPRAEQLMPPKIEMITVENVTKINKNKPLIVLCQTRSRLQPDINYAWEEIQTLLPKAVGGQAEQHVQANDASERKKTKTSVVETPVSSQATQPLSTPQLSDESPKDFQKAFSSHGVQQLQGRKSSSKRKQNTALVSKTLGAKAEQQFQASNSSENEETTVSVAETPVSSQETQQLPTAQLSHRSPKDSSVSKADISQGVHQLQEKETKTSERKQKAALVSKTLSAKAEQQFQASNSSENEETTVSVAETPVSSHETQQLPTAQLSDRSPKDSSVSKADISQGVHQLQEKETKTSERKQKADDARIHAATLVVHSTEESNLPTVPSRVMLTGEKYNKIRIIDVAFTKEQKFYACKMNTDAASELADFLKESSSTSP